MWTGGVLRSGWEGDRTCEGSDRRVGGEQLGQQVRQPVCSLSVCVRLLQLLRPEGRGGRSAPQAPWRSRLPEGSQVRLSTLVPTQT